MPFTFRSLFLSLSCACVIISNHSFIQFIHSCASFTGPSNPVAGYLTQAPSKKIEVTMSPPPMDRDDFTGYPTEE